MSEPKPFASLSSGLLARKGAARPAMRPQGFTQQSASLDDLGWNDMGHDEAKAAGDAVANEIVEHPRYHNPTGLTPVTSPVHSQQAEIADRFAEDMGEEEYDEEYDETAEPYEPEGGSGGFTGFDSAEEEPEEEGEEPEFRVQFKKPGRPLEEYGLTGRPADEVAPMAAADESGDDQDDDDVLELGNPVAEIAPMDAEPAHQAVFEPEPEPKAFPMPSPEPGPVRRLQSRAVPAGKPKAAFTLRLDPDRHLKLRLACAVDGRSAQQIVTDALDQLLGRMPELNDMADKARRG